MADAANGTFYGFDKRAFRFLTQSGLTTWRARPIASVSGGTDSVITDPAAT